MHYITLGPMSVEAADGQVLGLALSSPTVLPDPTKSERRQNCQCAQFEDSIVATKALQASLSACKVPVLFVRLFSSSSSIAMLIMFSNAIKRRSRAAR